MNIKPFFILTPLCLLAACGGGSDSTNSGTGSGSTPTPTPSLNNGGTFSNPAALSFNISNKIDAISADNYFTFNSSSNAILILHAELDSPLVMQDFTRCSSSSSGSTFSETYYSGLIVEDVWQSCSIDFSYQFSDAAEQILRIAYRYDTPGQFEAALFDPDTIQNSTLSTSASGRPDEPILIQEDQDNQLLANNFYNYYGIELSAGDEIQLDAYLNNAPTGQEPSRCQAQKPLDHYQGYGIGVDYDVYNCDESLRFTATETKLYIFHFKYTENDSSGYFRASIRRN